MLPGICWGTLEKINGRKIEISYVKQALSLYFPKVCVLNAIENPCYHYTVRFQHVWGFITPEKLLCVELNVGEVETLQFEFLGASEQTGSSLDFL